MPEITVTEPSFMHGIAVAFAELNRLFDQPTMCLDVLRNMGFSYQDFVRAGADEYDLVELRKIWRDG